MAIEKKKFYLGVEGGGTKSTAMLVDEKNRIIAQKEGEDLNYHGEEEKSVRKDLSELLASLLRKSKNGKLYTIFGLAGLDTKKDETFYRGLVKSALPPKSIFDVVNDTKTALEARCPNEQKRILVVSGTGANVYGENGAKTARSIGWGDFVLGDEGSGYDIVTKILKAAMRSFDGRGQKTIFESLVPKKMGVETIEDAVATFYKNLRRLQNMKRYVASFAYLLDEGIKNNDRVAMEIRKEAIEALLQGISAVTRKLAMVNEAFCLGYVGSVWKTPGMRQRFENEVKKQYPKVCFSKNDDPSAWGAVLLAKKLG